MTTRLINECFDSEELEEKTYNEFISMDLRNVHCFVVDPYMININDFKNMKSGRATLVRARRPAWE